MKAVIKTTLPFLLSLAGVVLAAPHQSTTLRQPVCTPVTCEISMDPLLNCRETKAYMAMAKASVPPVHDASGFLYW